MFKLPLLCLVLVGRLPLPVFLDSPRLPRSDSRSDSRLRIAMTNDTPTRRMSRFES